MISVNGQTWNGQFTGMLDDWQKALTLLKLIKSKDAGREASFGSVIERVITADDADNQGLVFFDIAGGKTLKPPFRLKLTNRLPDVVEITPELKEWTRANNVDLMFHIGEKGFSRMNLEMREGFAGQLNEWPTVEPEKVFEVLAKVDAQNTELTFLTNSSGIQDYRPSFGSFDAFRTRSKTLGVYQFTGVQTDTRRGVWIRYKLIQVAGDKVAESPPVVEHPAKAAGTEAPTFGPVIERGPFKDDFADRISDKWQVVGLKDSDYRVRNGGLEMRVQRGAMGRATPMLKVFLPFNSADSFAASVKVVPLDNFTQDGELAGLCLIDEAGPEFAAKLQRVDDKLVFAPPKYQFIGVPGEEGDPKKYDVKYTLATAKDSLLLITVRGGYAFFQAGAYNAKAYQGIFHSAIRGDSKKRGFCLVAAGAPEGAEHWVRFENFRVEDFTPTQPRARKKVNSRSTGESSPAFGPVIERTVNHGHENPVDSMIDLDTGKLFSVPNDLWPKPGEDTKSKKEAGEAWIRANGIDAVGCASLPAAGPQSATVAKIGLGGQDMLTVTTDKADWDKITPTDIESRLAQAKLEHRGRSDMMAGGELPATFLFQTREGGMGILQIVAFTEKPKAVKIRYKLVQGSPIEPAKAQAERRLELEKGNAPAEKPAASGRPAIIATGTIEPEEVIDVAAQVPGRIVSLGDDPRGATEPNYKGTRIDVGSPVEQGTVLARIDDALFKARVEERKAGVARAEAEVTAARAKAKDAAGDPTVAAAEAALAQAKAALKEAEIQLDRTTIRSPVKGVVVARRVNVGQTVAETGGPSLFLIAKDLGKMQVWAQVKEADLGAIRPGMAMTFTADAFPSEVFKGKVVQVRKNATQMQGSVMHTVVIEFANPDGKLKPYQSANVKFDSP